MLRSCPRPPPDLHPVKSLELTSGLLTSLLLCLSSYLPRTREAPYLTSPPCTSPTTAHRLDAGGDRPSPLRGGNSPSSVTHTMTHLGISGGPGPGYDVPGLHSPLSRPSLQSCLSNPNLQASLSGPHPQLQGSPITPPDRLPPAWPSTHRPHLSGSPLTQFPGPLHLLSAPSLVLPSPAPSHATPALLSLCPGPFPRHHRVPPSPRSLQAQPVPEGPNSSCPNSLTNVTHLVFHHSGRPPGHQKAAHQPAAAPISIRAPPVWFCPPSHPPQSLCSGQGCPLRPAQCGPQGASPWARSCSVGHCTHPAPVSRGSSLTTGQRVTSAWGTWSNSAWGTH